MCICTPGRREGKLPRVSTRISYPGNAYAVVGYNPSSSMPFKVFNPWGTSSFRQSGKWGNVDVKLVIPGTELRQTWALRAQEFPDLRTTIDNRCKLAGKVEIANIALIHQRARSNPDAIASLDANAPKEIRTPAVNTGHPCSFGLRTTSSKPPGRAAVANETGVGRLQSEFRPNRSGRCSVEEA